MTLPDITIAVDGFSATGKSTFAKLVAKDFGFLYLDSGAMYRAVTLFAQENGMIDADANIDLEALKKALDKGLDIHFEHTGEGHPHHGCFQPGQSGLGRRFRKEFRG